MLKGIFFSFALFTVWVGCSQPAHAQMTVPPIPRDGYVVDQTKTLSDEEVVNINLLIKSYRDQKGVQLAVLIVPEIAQDDYLERYSLNVARTWGVGDKEKNNGALLLVSKNDKKLRIEVGTGLEGDLTDIRAGQIIRDRITPNFRQGQFYAGIASGIEGMKLAIDATNDPKLLENTNESDWTANIGNLLEVIFFIGILAITWLNSILGRTKSWWAGGIIGGVLGGLSGYFTSGGDVMMIIFATLGLAGLGLVFDFLVSKNYKHAKNSRTKPSWWAGGTTLGGGGSSGGGFGGGSFGGGGASGSW